jgi:tetratricopeptide (TPR) repeat protein
MNHKIQYQRVWLYMSVLLIIGVITGCNQVSEQQVEILTRFESLDYEGQEVSSSRIEELRRDVQRYSRMVEQRIQAAGNIVSAYTLLGAEYQRMGMHRLALAAFQGALEVNPTNPQLLYQAGVAAGTWAATAPDLAQAQEYFLLAQRYYLRVLELDPFHRQTLYAMAVLLHFHFEDHSQAEALIDRFLAISSQDTRGLFLKARLLAQRGENVASAAIYGDIARITSDPRERNQALLNQREVLGSN